MPNNGTPQPPPPPPWPSSETTVPLRGSRPMGEAAGQYTSVLQPPNARSNFAGVQGRSSQIPGSMTGWNPAALLQPSRRGYSATDLRNLPSGRPQPLHSQFSNDQGRASPAVIDPMVFQFTSASDTSSNGHISGSSTPTPPNGEVPAVNGVGLWVERMNNVQHRSNVPHPKRRKTEDAQDFAARSNSIPVRSSSGMLGEYARDKRQQANGPTALTAAPTVDLTDGTDDEVMVIDDPKDEEVCYGMIKTNLNCTKVPSPKPGMQSVFGPGYNPGIKILLKRQTGERSLKIQACDHTREIIGFVEPSSAAALTPLLDTNIRLRTDCRIPPHPKKHAEEPGQPISRPYQLDIVMYGPQRYAKAVGSLLIKHNMKLIAPYMVQKGIKVYNPHVSEWRPVPPKMYPTNPQGTYTNAANRTVEEIRSEVMGVFDSLKRNDDLPLMGPNARILTPLLKHQKQGLYFMATREKPLNEQSTERAMVSFWQSKISASGEKAYSNVITGQEQRTPPPETRGGILADMMGLGKTLSILSLVTSTLSDAQVWEQASIVQRPKIDAKTSSNGHSASQTNFEPAPVSRHVKSTLIVCPLSTVTNWEEQMKQHVAEGSISCHIYHGSNRIKDVNKLAEFDIVITTYGSVSNELGSRRKGKDGLFPLEEIGWFRIVLDEAHMIREQSTLQFKAICRLQAERRWAVTGTPVQNRLDDLAALLSFLRLHPFDDRSKFNRYVVEPFKACDPEIVPKLRVLVDTVTLRRLKDKIDLPKREDLVIRLDFSPEERSIYELFAQNAQDRVKVLAGVNIGKGLGGSNYIHILKAILRLRLLCAHGKDLLNEEDLAALQGMSAELAINIDDDDDDGPALSHQKAHEMFSLMQDTNNDACIECTKKLNAAEGQNIESEQQDDVLGYMTPCFHVICRTCYRNYRERAQQLLDPDHATGPCLICGSHVRFEFVELRRDDVDAEHDGPAKGKARGGFNKRIDKYDGPHTKTKALIEDLLGHKAASQANPSEPPFKSVVFSGWTSHLDLIEIALNTANITFVRLDGSMTRTARTTAMEKFREDNSVEVILVSIMAGGLGLNLTAGNNVYVMEPQYNPAAEAQAIDRVHRLGQKRPVRTVRYIMRNSFEEKMLQLQEKKMKLASLSMDGQSKALDKAEAARQKLMDLRSLFK
ncbi:hypothetical protein QQS21_001349 [Conoideocrella luteorostrata]|uniref:SNF2 family DNA-dependent ATPase domain-containing protein n=1 Tax=Conoideocrella luteorostrata TaxID=1105319 RepID=A0AAJ0D026_9HYPO|nr:hypothetical protein QQS21_001349 [Conoideocrella luteorostrata]